jgi:uncharacterized membrane protein
MTPDVWRILLHQKQQQSTNEKNTKMKKLITFTAGLLFMMAICKAQDSLHNVSPNNSIKGNQYAIPDMNSREYFMEKGSKLNTTAWVLLGVGATLGTTGLILYENAHNQNDWENVSNTFSGIFLIAAGSALVVTSVPIFIRSGYYKRKGLDMSASIKLEPYQSGVALKHYPSVGLSIRL